MGEMTLAFETDRLPVFQASVQPGDCSPPSIIYVAFLKSGGAAQTVAHAVVTDQRGKGTSALFPLFRVRGIPLPSLQPARQLILAPEQACPPPLGGRQA
jgi:hypothetical protein